MVKDKNLQLFKKVALAILSKVFLRISGKNSIKSLQKVNY